MKDLFTAIISILISGVVVGYLQQENIIPQENIFTTIIALIVAFLLIGSFVNVIIGNAEYKKDTVFASTPEKETVISAIVFWLSLIIAIIVLIKYILV